MSDGTFLIDRETAHDLQSAQKYIIGEIAHLTKLSTALGVLFGAIFDRKKIALTLAPDRRHVAATVNSGDTILFEGISWESFKKWIVPQMWGSFQDQISFQERMVRYYSAEILPQ